MELDDYNTNENGKKRNNKKNFDPIKVKIDIRLEFAYTENIYFRFDESPFSMETLVLRNYYEDNIFFN